MAAFSRSPSWVALVLLLFVAIAHTANAISWPKLGADKLSARYYAKSCPNVQQIVWSVMAKKVAEQPRMAPAILRLFFHDCFVNVWLRSKFLYILLIIRTATAQAYVMFYSRQ